MKLPVFALAFAIAAIGSIAATAAAPAAAKLPPLRDPVFLNIGFVCQWQARCMERQKAAMKRALGYVRKADPPRWKIHLCNRNASRARGRVDWIGFDHCIRNRDLRRSTASRR